MTHATTTVTRTAKKAMRCKILMSYVLALKWGTMRTKSKKQADKLSEVEVWSVASCPAKMSDFAGGHVVILSRRLFTAPCSSLDGHWTLFNQ